MGNILFDLACFIGVRIRFFILKFIGVPKPLKYLKGESGDGANKVSHGCINLLIGIPFVFGVIVGIAYVYFTLF